MSYITDNEGRKWELQEMYSTEDEMNVRVLIPLEADTQPDIHYKKNSLGKWVPIPETDTPDMGELDEILALIKYDIEYADTHGGCPPAVRGVTRHGVAEAKQAILQLIATRESRLLDRVRREVITDTCECDLEPEATE